jgi:hypothetical protein
MNKNINKIADINKYYKSIYKYHTDKYYEEIKSKE